MRVRLVEGTVRLGSGPGRGAWICPRQACLARALAKGRLARALRDPGASGPGVAEQLRVALGALVDGAERGSA